MSKRANLKPHAYIYRSYRSNDASQIKDTFLEPEKGIIIFKDGHTYKGEKMDVFDTALAAKAVGKLEAFAVLDKDDGLLLSRGSAEESVGVHGHKHPTKQHVAYLHIPEKDIEYHGVWQEDKRHFEVVDHKQVIEEHLDTIRSQGDQT